jgi:hypothetical protein
MGKGYDVRRIARRLWMQLHLRKCAKGMPDSAGRTVDSAGEGGTGFIRSDRSFPTRIH